VSEKSYFNVPRALLGTVENLSKLYILKHFLDILHQINVSPLNQAFFENSKFSCMINVIIYCTDYNIDFLTLNMTLLAAYILY